MADLIDKIAKSSSTLDQSISKAAEGIEANTGRIAKSAEELNRIYSRIPISQAPEPMSADEKNANYQRAGKRLGTTARYFAWGGPVGTDTIPAWLGRDEVVMNGRASKRWYSQLMQMNRGRTPDLAKPSAGGPAIGSLNITVQGGQTNQQTGVEIASALQRAINLGAVRLRNN